MGVFESTLPHLEPLIMEKQSSLQRRSEKKKNKNAWSNKTLQFVLSVVVFNEDFAAWR